MPDVLAMLANITAGKTVLGKPNSNLRPMIFPTAPSIRVVTGAALDLSARIIGGLDDEAREFDFTNFARKVALYANRGGTRDAEPSFITRVCHAADFAHDNPHLMRSGILIPAIYFTAMRERARQPAATQPTWRDEIVQMAVKASPPTTTVVWENETAHYQLHQLTHPFHVWEEGVALKNCLCRINPWLPSTRVHGDAPADTLWSLAYWNDVSNGTLTLYSLRSGTARIALLGISEGMIAEFSVAFPNEAGLPQLLVAIFAFLAARSEPLHIITTHMKPRERTIVFNIKNERANRVNNGGGA